ncbi:hypothetical protein ACFH04_08030 [Streptomyces noboritoensis]|uniref:Uncharacterized protein n=1 Tax=Streptomyces noboritoensis TaxID=67337 RepID=A0ABV6TD16_9ACTN
MTPWYCATMPAMSVSLVSSGALDAPPKERMGVPPFLVKAVKSSLPKSPVVASPSPW